MIEARLVGGPHDGTILKLENFAASIEYLVTRDGRPIKLDEKG